MENEWRLIRTKRNKFYYINQNGNKSEKFFCAEEYRNGFAKVQKYKAGSVYFRDVDGNLSERFHDAYNYCNGFALVCKGPTDAWQFRDIQGNLSEGFYDAYNYHNGFAIVRKGPIDAWQFRDTQGNLSEGFYSVVNYQGSFAKVQKAFQGPYQYRDIYGNLHNSLQEGTDALKKMQTKQLASEQTQNNSCATIEEYFKNEVSAYALSPKDIYNNLNKIVAWEKYNCKLELENADNDKRNEIFERYSEVAEYIKYTAYEYSEEQKKNRVEIDEYIESLF